MTIFTPTLAMLDGWTIALLAGAFIMIFGGSKLPELARGLGKARREFRKASEEVDDEIRGAIEEDERKKARSKIIEEEERARIRAKIEEEERTKLADKNKQA